VSYENTPAIVRLTMILVFATGLLIGFMVNTAKPSVKSPNGSSR
jgi:hypothetical protein